MRYTNRPFIQEEDYWRARTFLREVFLLNNRHEVCWQPYRLDYWRWHVLRNCRETDVHGKLRLWENEAAAWWLSCTPRAPTTPGWRCTQRTAVCNWKNR
jgi:hypothetical protein